MRILHTSDLHIGKRLNDVNLIEDQKYVLEQIINIAENQKCDAVIIAGDVYDKSNPSAEAMTLFNDFLMSLSERKIPVYIISGNHDSQERVAYFSGFARNMGVYISDGCKETPDVYTLEDEYGKVNICLLPFIKPVEARRILPDRKIETYEDAVRELISNVEINESERNIMVCHQYVTGASLCDSEELAIGGLDNISAELFDKFDYVAMGHIHGPQKIKRETLRYSGSPLKYSFSEANHKKSVTIADFKEKGEITVTTAPLELLHDVREVKGGLVQLMDMPYSEDYVRVTVTDENVVPDARISLLTVFPNMMKFAVENSKTAGQAEEIELSSVEDRSPTELFCDFYKFVNNNEPPTQEHIALFNEAMEGLGEDKK
ncbi:MAG: exonuclease SbcCD subunit D [Ruminococcus sp.]|nr:exonuclease SbcCD subunit D [Ruminococcus sp.]